MKKLEYQRRLKGLGIRDLARASRVSAGSLCRAENNAPVLDAQQLERIAQALGYDGDPATLLDDLEV